MSVPILESCTVYSDLANFLDRTLIITRETNLINMLYCIPGLELPLSISGLAFTKELGSHVIGNHMVEIIQEERGIQVKINILPLPPVLMRQNARLY